MDKANLLESLVVSDVTITGKELGRGVFLLIISSSFEIDFELTTLFIATENV